jgi:hypothetical protein
MSDQFFTVVFHGNVRALKSNPLHIKSAFGDAAIVSSGNVHAERDELEVLNGELLEALQNLLTKYVRLVESGDAGFWNAEAEDEVIKARSAIRKATEG